MRVTLALLGLPLALAASSLDTFVGTETSVALAGILSNTGPNGSKASGAKSGIIIASPSTSCVAPLASRS